MRRGDTEVFNLIVVDFLQDLFTLSNMLSFKRSIQALGLIEDRLSINHIVPAWSITKRRWLHRLSLRRLHLLGGLHLHYLFDVAATRSNAAEAKCFGLQ